MKLLMLLSLVIGFQVFASEPPANYPVVKGVIRKIDHAAMRLSIKHDDIPNLDMPGMTMSFKVKEHSQMAGLAVNDKINFVADEVDGEITVLWIEKENTTELPQVKGIVRKIDVTSGRVSIKHERIPNLDMPGMTMSFQVQDKSFLEGLSVGDAVLFTAAEVDGELTLLSIKKSKPAEIGKSELFCTGIAATSPKSKVEIEVRNDKFSTIRYEHIEGPYKGTAHVNSIGRLALHQEGDQIEYRAGAGEWNTKLSFKLSGQEIIDSRFTHYSSGMKNTTVNCSFE